MTRPDSAAASPVAVPAPGGGGRLPMFDTLKALASQLIVLHHLAFYGPISEALERGLPWLQSWLVSYGRLAVQSFLVIGGFFAAKALAPYGRAAIEHPLALLGRRYLRLVVPFAAALALAVTAAAAARLWLDDDMVPAAPGGLQVLTHLLLLHGVLGIDSLSAGVWYVAIDFQLFVALLGLLWLAQRTGRTMASPLFVGGLALASLFYFNRDAGWDAWSIYFFGSYALGVAAYWVSAHGRNVLWTVAIAAVGSAALAVDFRIRIAVALLTALLLCIMFQTGWSRRWPDLRPTAFLGRVSYSVFLVHFPVCLVANAAVNHFYPSDTGAGLVAGLLAWGSSVAAGTLFYRFVESRSWSWPRSFSELRLFGAVRGGAAVFGTTRYRSARSNPEEA